MGGKLLFTTSRKSHMGFRLVPKSVTLHDLERRNGHYFALFRGIELFSWQRKSGELASHIFSLEMS